MQTADGSTHTAAVDSSATSAGCPPPAAVHGGVVGVSRGAGFSPLSLSASERRGIPTTGARAGALKRRERRAPSSAILIAGVGNLLLSDDGVGIHAVRELEKSPLPGVTIVDLGTAVWHGLAFLESAGRVLIIDAARGGRPPGTVYLFDEPGSGEISSLGSIHALGLREAARLLLAEGTAPPMTVLGVEPASLSYGMELSPPVRTALPAVLALARETVTTWMRSPEPINMLSMPEMVHRIPTHPTRDLL
jgi:hydrogenase maturation protease